MLMERQKRQVERCDGRRMHPAIAGFEGERGPYSEQCRKPLEAGNKPTNKEMDSSLVHLQKPPDSTLVFTQ